MCVHWQVNFAGQLCAQVGSNAHAAINERRRRCGATLVQCAHDTIAFPVHFSKSSKSTTRTKTENKDRVDEIFE